MALTLPDTANLGDTGHITDHNLITTALSTLETDLAAKAPLASPALTGSPTVNGLPIGKVLQVVSVAKTSVFSSSSTSYVDVTGLSANITPYSTSSKIVVIANIAGSSSATNQATWVAAIRATSTNIGFVITSTFAANGSANATLLLVDSPSTTSSTNYKIQIKSQTTTYSVSANSDTSTLLLVEIGP